MIARVPDLIRDANGKDRLMLGARMELVLCVHAEVPIAAHRSIALGVKALVRFIGLYPEGGQDTFGIARIKRRNLNPRPSCFVVHLDGMIEHRKLIRNEGIVYGEGGRKKPLARDPMGVGDRRKRGEQQDQTPCPEQATPGRTLRHHVHLPPLQNFIFRQRTVRTTCFNYIGH